MRAQLPAPERSNQSNRFEDLVSHEFARRHLIVPEDSDEVSPLRLLVSESTSPLDVWNVATALGCSVTTRTVPGEHIVEQLAQLYTTSDRDTASLAEGASKASAESIEALVDAAGHDLLRTDGQGPLIQLMNAMLLEALNRRASDVHVQASTESLEVRYRVDGILHTARELPLKLQQPLISRIKVMGEMDIAERLVPQDGRAMVTLGGASRRTVDLRISTIPTKIGERAVIRILEFQGAASDLGKLGMPDELASEYRTLASSSNGMILLTGPTGSGKTTTLYATLHTVGRPEQNIMTIEDPIEFQLGGDGLSISQSQVNPAKGMTFASGLRNILRQDPDIVMVGEIRDAETAAMAIQASLTGHLVFSTLHTNDAPSAVTRLENLGVDRYLICDSLLAVMAQRLVRRIHTPCDGAGCDDCLGSGYLGRAGLYELMRVSPAIRAAINSGADAARLKALAVGEGMKTLRDRGEAFVSEGLTTPEEVLRLTSGAL